MTVHDPALDRARKRARELREFYSHLVSYVVVGTMLVVIDLFTTDLGTETFLGLDWAYWPILGWGIFVAIHAVKTFTNLGQWEERKANQLYEMEKQQGPLHH